MVTSVVLEYFQQGESVCDVHSEFWGQRRLKLEVDGEGEEFGRLGNLVA